jgi:hypothetical protein
MLFFFKEKPIEITAIISSQYLFAKEYSPIVQAKELIPEWWKNTMPSKFDWEQRKSVNTSKSCPAIINCLTKGLILPLWSDLAIQWNDTGWAYDFSDEMSQMHNHPEYQTPGYYSNFWHFKIDSPWIFKTDVNLMYIQPTYLRNTPYPYFSPYGILPSMNGVSSSNVFCFVEKNKNDNKLLIKHKTPLLHIIPMSDKKIKLNIEVLHPLDFVNYRNLMGIKTTFGKTWANKLRNS